MSGGRNPRGAEAGGDSGGRDVLRLGFEQRLDVSGILGVEGGGRLSGGELGPHRAGEIGVRRLPALGHGIAEDRGAQLLQRLVRLAFQQLGQTLGIDMADLVEGDGERVGGRGDERRRRRRDHALIEDRTLAGDAGVQVVILDAGDQPAIRVVGEVREVRAAVDLPLLAGLRVLEGGDDGVVDRAVVADEARIGRSQLDLGLRPGPAAGLGAEHFAHGIADRHEGAG